MEVMLGSEALRSQRTLLESVFRRAAALNGLKEQGVLDAELENTLAWQLGLEGRSQEAGAADTEADAGTDAGTTGAAGSAEARQSGPPFSVIPGDPKGPRQDKPNSWEEVKPRHLWASAKRFLPKLDDPRPGFGIKRGSWDHLVQSLANWLKIMPPVTDPWGTSVKLANPQERGGFGDPMENRAAHLIGRDAVKGTEQRAVDFDKLSWMGAVRQTISDAQVRVRSGAETLYFRSYKDGVHMVVTADGAVQDQRVLVTQYAPELSAGKFQGAVVEKTRSARLAPQGSPGAVGIRAQPQHQTVQTPTPGTQGNPTPVQGQSQEGEGAQQEQKTHGQPSSARSEEGRATGATSASPDQSDVAPGMSGNARPVADGATPGESQTTDEAALLGPSSLGSSSSAGSEQAGASGASGASSTLSNHAAEVESAGGISFSALPSPDDHNSENSRRNAGRTYSPAIDVARGDRSAVRPESRATVVRGSGKARATQFQRLLKWAREGDRVFSPNRLGKELDQGGEHVVHQAADDPGRVYKVTFPNHSGLTRVALETRDGGTRVVEEDALPDEYLERWNVFNQAFEDDVRFLGVMETPAGPSLVVSQRILEGPHPSAAEVASYLSDELGFRETGGGNWYRESDGLAVSDTKPANFVLSGGRVYAIDAIPFRVTPAIRAAWGLSETDQGTEETTHGLQNGGTDAREQQDHGGNTGASFSVVPADPERSRQFVERVGSPSSLDTAQEQQVFDNFRKRVAQDVPAAVQEYIERFGHVVDTDLAREMEPAYSQSRETRQEYARATSPVASALAREVYDTLLEEVPPGAVLFNAGGPGSGKSSTLGNTQKYAIVYDTVMADGKRAIEQIERAMAKGHKVSIRYIHQPLDTAVRNTIERAADVENGRIVEAYATARSHLAAQKAIFEVARRFEGNPSVSIQVVDNTNFGARPITLQELQSLRYTEPLEVLEKRAIDVAKEYFNEHRTRPEFTTGLEQRILRAPSQRRP